jgi:hypothetical protein
MLDPTCAHHAQHRERSPTAPAPAMTVQPRSRFPDAGQVACVKRARLGLEHAGDPVRRDRHAVDIPARPTGASAATATPPPSTRRAPVEPEPRTERRHRCERPAAPSDERPPPTPPSPSPIIQPAGWRRRQRPLPPRRRPRSPPRRSRLRGAVAETAGDEESSFRTRSQAATGHGRTAARMRTATARRPYPRRAAPARTRSGRAGGPPQGASGDRRGKSGGKSGPALAHHDPPSCDARRPARDAGTAGFAGTTCSQRRGRDSNPRTTERP